MAYYPSPDPTRDINSNQILDDYTRQVPYSVDRDNYDTKFTWQRSAAHSIWGKFSMLNADVRDNFILGFDPGSLGDTKVYVATAGHTWTLGPTLILDGNFGANIQNQTVTGPDFGTNYGIDLGIPGVNDPERHPRQRPADLRERLHHRRHAELDAARTARSAASPSARR